MASSHQFIRNLEELFRSLGGNEKTAADYEEVGANVTDDVMNDSSVSADTPGQKDYETGEYHEETEQKLDEDYHGHAGKNEENTDSDLEDHYHRTELSPEISEAGEGGGENIEKNKGEEYQEGIDSTFSVAKKQASRMTNYQLAAAIEACIDQLMPELQRANELLVAHHQAVAKTAQALRDVEILQYTSAHLTKLAEEAVADLAAGGDETAAGEPGPEDTEEARNKLLDLLQSLAGGGSADVAQEEPAPEEETGGETEEVEEEPEEEEEGEKTGSLSPIVEAELFNRALDDLGIKPHELLLSKKIKEKQAARLVKTLLQYRKTARPMRLSIGSNPKLIERYNQFVDYIRDIMS
jgi:hypothetical protein